MDNLEQKREEVFSTSVRAGKRTYFMDVKEMKSGERYLTITESKRRFIEEEGKFVYDKHKILLCKEDFDKFKNGLDIAIRFVETGEMPEELPIAENGTNVQGTSPSNFSMDDKEFEML